MTKRGTDDNKRLADYNGCPFKRDDGKLCDLSKGHKGLHRHGLLIFADNGEVLNF